MVIGGQPHYYAEELRERLPNIPLIVPGGSMFANCRGFYALGRIIADAKSEATA